MNRGAKRQWLWILGVVLAVMGCHPIEGRAITPSQGLIVDYNFQNNLEDRKQGSKIHVFKDKSHSPFLQYNDKTGFSADADGEYWYWQTTSPRGGGFYLDVNERLENDHAIALRFSFADTGGLTRGQGYKKIVDYKNMEDDTGFYFYYKALRFYDYGGTYDRTFENNQVLDLVAVREKDGTFNAYTVVDGIVKQELHEPRVDEQSIPAIVDGKSRVGFFFDDVASGGGEATPSGKIYNLKIWNRALAPEEIGTILDKQPEKPQLDLLHPGETRVKGTTSPAVEIRVKNQAGKEFRGTSDKTGAFALTVDPLLEGETLTTYAINRSGLESEVLKTPIRYTLSMRAKTKVLTLSELQELFPLTPVTVKQLVQTQADNLLTNQVIEDSRKGIFSKQVTLPSEQLTALQSTKEPMPIPIDFTVAGNNKNRQKRAWVHVIKRTSDYLPDPGLIFYGQDIQLNQQVVREISEADMLQLIDGKIYQEIDDGEALTPLNQVGKLRLAPGELAKIQKTKGPARIIVKLEFEWEQHHYPFTVELQVEEPILKYTLERNQDVVTLADVDLEASNLAPMKSLDIASKVLTLSELQELFPLTPVTVKQLVQTQADNLLTNQVIEDSRKGIFSKQVTLPSEQLTALQSTKEPMPIPIDFTVAGNNKNRQKRAWVHVIKRTSDYLPDPGLIFYGQDIQLNQQVVREISEADMLQLIDGKIYQEIDDGEALTPLNQVGKLRLAPGELAKIQKTKGPARIIVKLEFEWEQHHYPFTVELQVEEPILKYTLERNQDVVTLADVDLEASNLAPMKSLDIASNVPLKIADSELPKGWQAYQTARSHTFVFNENNDPKVIRAFLAQLRLILTNKQQTEGTVTIRLNEEVIVPWQHPDGTTHFYKFMPADLNWYQAYNQAKSERYQGLTGYLMTITSQGENEFVKEALSLSPGWLGGSRQVYQSGAKFTDEPHVSETYTDYATNKEEWYWANGPETGRVFSIGKTNARPVDGEFSQWSYNEPNNTIGFYSPPSGSNDPRGTQEDTLQWGKDGTIYWNDLSVLYHGSKSWIAGYYVEFSEYGGQQIKPGAQTDQVISTTEWIPQPVLFQGQDEVGKPLKAGDNRIERGLRIGKAYTIVPKKVPDYTYQSVSGAPLTGVIGKALVQGILHYQKDVGETELTIEFRDLDQEEIHSPIVLRKPQQSVVNLRQETEVTETINQLSKDFYSVESRPAEEEQIRLTTDKQTVTYTFAGSVGFQVPPTTLRFSESRVANTVQKQPVLANEVALNIRDNRRKAERGKYRVSAQLTTPFTNAAGGTIPQCRLVFSAPINQAIVAEEETVLFTSQGTEKLEQAFVLVDKGKQELELTIPRIRTQGEYQATITWQIVIGM